MSRITNKQCLAVYDRGVETGLDADSPAMDLPQLGSLASVINELHIVILKTS